MYVLLEEAKFYNALGLCPADRILIGDKEVGPYLTLCPEFSFVCENSLDGSIVGYACAAPDAKTFYNRYNMVKTSRVVSRNCITNLFPTNLFIGVVARDASEVPR